LEIYGKRRKSLKKKKKNHESRDLGTGAYLLPKRKTAIKSWKHQGEGMTGKKKGDCTRETSSPAIGPVSERVLPRRTRGGENWKHTKQTREGG